MSDVVSPPQITCHDPHHEWAHMVDVEVAARALSKTVSFKKKRTVTQRIRSTRAKLRRAKFYSENNVEVAQSKVAAHGYMRLSFAARDRLLMGPPLTLRLQKKAAGEDPAISDVTSWARVIGSLLTPEADFGVVVFGAESQQSRESRESGGLRQESAMGAEPSPSFWVEVESAIMHTNPILGRRGQRTANDINTQMKAARTARTARTPQEVYLRTHTCKTFSLSSPLSSS